MSETNKKEYFVTTVDNPYNYFTQFDDWFRFDTEKGYNTLSLVGRLVHTSNAMSDADNEEEIDRVVDEILHYNVLGLYKKVYNN